MLRGLVAEGVTALLTTQYLNEADVLADEIVVIDKGRVIAEGTPGRAEGRGRAGRCWSCGRSGGPPTWARARAGRGGRRTGDPDRG